MPRFFFDTFANGKHTLDDEGLDLDRKEVRMQAMRTLPEIAKDDVPKDGDRQAFMVLAKDEAGKAVYSATLTFAGLWLNEDGGEDSAQD